MGRDSDAFPFRLRSRSQPSNVVHSPHYSTLRHHRTSEDAEPAEETANVRDAVFGLVQGRHSGLLGKSSRYIESLPDGAKKTFEALKGVQ
jgi:hypothetical protein